MKSKFDDQCYATTFLREKTTFIYRGNMRYDRGYISRRFIVGESFIAVKNFTDKRSDDG